MQDYWVILIAVLCAILLLSVIFVSIFFYIRQSKLRQKKKQVPMRAPSRIHPKIPDPIFSVTPNNSLDKPVSAMDTVTTRKLSMMFDTKKRLSSAFSQRSSYFDFENSPQPKHKEYLDFADIEKILPRKANSVSGPTGGQPPSEHRPKSSLGAMERGALSRISIIEEAPFSGPSFEPVREVFSENHVSFRRDRPNEG